MRSFSFQISENSSPKVELRNLDAERFLIQPAVVFDVWGNRQAPSRFVSRGTSSKTFGQRLH